MNKSIIFKKSVNTEDKGKMEMSATSKKNTKSKQNSPKVINKKSNANGEIIIPNMTAYEKDYILINLLNVLFQQIKLQQEVRDRWFGHYLTIIASLTALATLCLKFFDSVVQRNILYIFLGMMFEFAFIIGSMFFALYLCQRKNYKEIYSSLSEVQKEIVYSIDNTSDKYLESTFKTKRYGADFFTLLIQCLIDSTMFSIGIVYLYLSQGITVSISIVFSLMGFIFVFAVLQLIYDYFEGR